MYIYIYIYIYIYAQRLPPSFARIHVSARPGATPRAHALVYSCVRVCLYACMHVYVSPCMHAACVYDCLRVHVCLFAHTCSCLIGCLVAWSGRLVTWLIGTGTVASMLGTIGAETGEKGGKERGGEAILHYTILYYTILYYTILYYTILYHTIPYHTIPDFSKTIFSARRGRRPGRPGCSGASRRPGGSPRGRRGPAI